jgi:hypothetical protein
VVISFSPGWLGWLSFLMSCHSFIRRPDHLILA